MTLAKARARSRIRGRGKVQKWNRGGGARTASAAAPFDPHQAATLHSSLAKLASVCSTLFILLSRFKLLCNSDTNVRPPESGQSNDSFQTAPNSLITECVNLI